MYSTLTKLAPLITIISLMSLCYQRFCALQNSPLNSLYHITGNMWFVECVALRCTLSNEYIARTKPLAALNALIKITDTNISITDEQSPQRPIP